MPSFFDLYKIWSGGNESPPIFHRWAAYSLLAGVLGRKVRFRFGHFTFYPNLYVVLVGPPGIAKSVAIDIAQGIGRHIEAIHYGSDDSSYQQLIFDIRGSYQESIASTGEIIPHQSLNVCLSEMGSMMDFQNTKMMKLLCRAFDSPPGKFVYTTIKHGAVALENYLINLLGACTPADIPKIFGPGADGAGLSSRILYIFADIPGPPIPRPVLTPEQQAAKKEIIAILNERARLGGEMRFSDEASAHFDDWYLNRMRRAHPDHRMASFYSRLRVNVPKTAMLQALSRGSMEISPMDLELAISDIDALAPGLKRAMAAVGTAKAAPFIEMVMTQLRMAHPAPVSENMLFDGFLHNLPEKDMREALFAMIKTGRIARVEGPQPGYGLGPNGLT